MRNREEKEVPCCLAAHISTRGRSECSLDASSAGLKQHRPTDCSGAGPVCTRQEFSSANGVLSVERALGERPRPGKRAHRQPVLGIQFWHTSLLWELALPDNESLFLSLFSLSYFSPSCSGYLSHPTHFVSALSLIFPFLSFHFHYLPCPLSFPAVLLIFYRPAFSSRLPSLSCSSFAVPTACLLALFRHRGPGVPVALCPRYVTVSLYCYLIAASLLSIPLLSSICTAEDQES